LSQLAASSLVQVTAQEWRTLSSCRSLW